MPIKLKGDAQQCLFNYLFRYVRRQFLMSVGTDGKALMHPMFLRYLLCSKSNSTVCRYFFNSSIVTLMNNGIRLQFKAHNYERFYHLPSSIFLSIQHLIESSGWTLCVDSKFESIANELAPLLKGHLHIKITSFDYLPSSALEFFQRIHNQIREFTCIFHSNDTARLGNNNLFFRPNFPQMTLDTFRLEYRDEGVPAKFSHIFRHRIERLELLFYGNHSLSSNYVSHTLIEHNTIKHLTLQIENANFINEVLPFVENFCIAFPKLKTLDLQTSYSPIMSHPTNILVEIDQIYADIQEFRLKAMEFLDTLSIDFNGRVWVYDQRYAKSDWIQQLAQNLQFKYELVERNSNTNVIRIIEQTPKFKLTVEILIEPRQL